LILRLDGLLATDKAGGLRYPLMKLVDMYFWQIGFELDGEKKSRRQWARRKTGDRISRCKSTD